jgi:hypothetical protein
MSDVEWGPFVVSLLFVAFALFLILTSGTAARLQTPPTPKDGVENEDFTKRQLQMRREKQRRFRLIGLCCLVPAFGFVLFGIAVSV